MEMDGGGMTMTPPASMPMHMSTMHMTMTFFWGRKVEVLFSGWPGDRGTGMYVLALVFVVIIAGLTELLSALYRRLSGRRCNRSKPNSLVVSGVYAVRMGMEYMVMLAVMSFNGGVLIAAVAGHGLGYLAARSGFFSRVGGLTEEQDALPSTGK